MGSGTHSSRRDGFTLIELLVVLAILSLLVGLTMAGISRVRTVQQSNSTESTLQKLQKAVNQQLSADMDEATRKGNPYLTALQQAIQDNDLDRAKSLLSYAYSKRDFPMNFAEATTPVLVVPAHSGFRSVAGPTGLSADQQAAVLLYIIVHDMASRGTTIDADGALASAEMAMVDPLNGKTYKAYKDAYGTHVSFLRWYQGDPNIQNPPYVNPNDQVKGLSVDPFDRLGKLAINPWPPPNNSPPPNNARFKSLIALNNFATILLPDFDGRNKVITVISAGPDKAFGTPDDVFGYPLARFGARGD